jgi:hypothetical protein
LTAVTIGFVNESVDGAVPGRTLSICVAILDPKPPDIDPMWRIPIEILVSTANAATGMYNINSVCTIDRRFLATYNVNHSLNCL